MKPNAQLKREEDEARIALEVTANMLRRHADNGALIRIAENDDARRRCASVRCTPRGSSTPSPAHGANG